MKLFLKKNLLTILFFLILIIWSGYWVVKQSVPTEIKNDPIIYFYITISDNMLIIEMIAPFLVIIPSVNNFHKELHSGYLKNCLTRISYKKYMLLSYFKSIIKSLILPLFVIATLIMCCIKSGSINFGSGVEFYGYFSSPPPQFAPNIVQFMIIFLIGIILNSIFYVHLGIIFSKKNANFLVSTILAFITFIGIDIIGECFVGGILLPRIFDIHYTQDIFNLFNAWCYDGISNPIFCLIYYTFLVLVSGLIIYIIYKKKEDVIIEIEK